MGGSFHAESSFPSDPVVLADPVRPRVLKQVQLFAPLYDVTTCGFGGAPDGVVEHIEIPGDARAWVDDRVAVATRRYETAYWNIKAVAEAKPRLAGRTFDGILANDLNAVPLALSLEPRAAFTATSTSSRRKRRTTTCAGGSPSPRSCGGSVAGT